MIDGMGVLNTEAEKFLPEDLNITDTNEKEKAGESVKEFYFGDKKVSKENLNEYTKVITDFSNEIVF